VKKQGKKRKKSQKTLDTTSAACYTIPSIEINLADKYAGGLVPEISRENAENIYLEVSV
jgi:hypothetical protein